MLSLFDFFNSDCGCVEQYYRPQGADLSTGIPRTLRNATGTGEFSTASAYSMTSSANTRSFSGTVNPNAFAVLMLITSSNLTGV
jgi:hypothetical protein